MRCAHTAKNSRRGTESLHRVRRGSGTITQEAQEGTQKAQERPVMLAFLCLGRRMKRFFYITAMVVFLGVLPARAQSPSTGAQLSGTIMDSTGAIVRDASV